MSTKRSGPRPVPPLIGKAAKTAWHYDPNTPRCEKCVNFRPARAVLRDSLPVKGFPAICHIGQFITLPGGVCDRWTARDGTTLEIAA